MLWKSNALEQCGMVMWELRRGDRNFAQSVGVAWAPAAHGKTKHLGDVMRASWALSLDLCYLLESIL